ncbi:MAG: hypothetical protein MJ016_06775 [Victivallaceae bacterium]|nr:hypothetical protein [Victivallaceae bacterium]
MMKSFFAGILLAVLCGCGHNVVNYGDGIMLETTCNPETFTFGFLFRHGKILSAALRENCELVVDTAADGNAAPSDGTAGGAEKAASSASIRLKTGEQNPR